MDVAVLATIVALTAQSTATIAGRVVADDNGSPIPNARVSVTTTNGLGAPVALTDADGRFTLLVSGNSRAIQATKTTAAQKHRSRSATATSASRSRSASRDPA